MHLEMQSKQLDLSEMNWATFSSSEARSTRFCLKCQVSLGKVGSDTKFFAKVTPSSRDKMKKVSWKSKEDKNNVGLITRNKEQHSDLKLTETVTLFRNPRDECGKMNYIPVVIRKKVKGNMSDWESYFKNKNTHRKEEQNGLIEGQLDKKFVARWQRTSL